MPLASAPSVFRAVTLGAFIVFNHLASGFLLWRLYRQKNQQEMFFVPMRRSISGKTATANYNSFLDTKQLITVKICLGLLDLTVKENSREVLRGVNGVFRSGELVLALGDAESGLTALLDVIGGVFKEISGRSAEIIGGIHINNYQPHAQFLQKLVGYVHKGELSFGKLSAKDTLRYYALVKMSRSAPLSEKHDRADALLREFGFTDKLYTPACDLTAEFKLRLSIAVQMINNPFIVIVDDQLKGLDFTATRDILDLLKKLSLQGRVVICAAPYAQGWMMKMVDNVLIMSQGGVAYFGKSGYPLLKHFRKTGYEVPLFHDAILYVLSLLKVDKRNGGSEVDSKNRIRSIMEKRSNSAALDEIVELQKFQFPKVQMLTDTRGYERHFLLFKRMIAQRLKQPFLIILHLLMPLVYSVIVCMIFSDSLTDDLYGIQSRMGIITAFNLYIVFGFLHGFLFFPKENEIFIKDHQSNTCTPRSFYLAYITCEFILNFISSILVTLIVMFANQMHVTPESFFAFTFFIILLLNSGQAFSTIIVSLVTDTDVAISVFAVGVAVVVSFSSFVSTDSFIVLDLLRYLSVLANISFVLAQHEFDSSMLFNCDVGPRLLFTHACPVTGDMVLTSFKLEERGSEAVLVGVAFLCTFFYQIISFVCFSKLQRSLTKR